MLTMLHRYIRRMIRWINSPSDDELQVLRREKWIAQCRRIIMRPDHDRIGDISVKDAVGMLSVLDEAAFDPFAGENFPDHHVEMARATLRWIADGRPAGKAAA